MIQFYEKLSDYRSCNEYPIYFKKEYLESQHNGQFLVAEDDNYLILLSIENCKATSLSKSPFGSFYQKKINANFQAFERELSAELTKRRIKEFRIKQPASIYQSFLKDEEIQKSGYTSLYQDLSQHIVLDESWQGKIHKMQQRKLKSLQEDGFKFDQYYDFKKAYQFLSLCRQAQGVEINILWEQLNRLIISLKNGYKCFAITRKGKLSAMCITVNVTKDIAYYFIPGTSPLFRSQSPMVMLIAGIVAYYRNHGFKYLDLGVSSIQGEPQETLKVFKERMGAEKLLKSTLIKVL